MFFLLLEIVLWLTCSCHGFFHQEHSLLGCSPSSRMKGQLTGWNDLEAATLSWTQHDRPISIDTALQPETTVPTSSSSLKNNNAPLLIRERHGWCPYSERVWLTLELANIDYTTYKIDNTGGPRPNWFAGQTPQLQLPNESRPKGESMDLVDSLDRFYVSLQLQSENDKLQDIVKQFSSVFPRARPSSRAAYLFQYNGEPLGRKAFEATLETVNGCLGQSDGPFFGTHQPCVADIAYLPFLERYRYQLPVLHHGLSVMDYPHIQAFFDALTKIPEYACRVAGDASSWRKVLSMAGFGNAGFPPQIQQNVDLDQEVIAAKACIDLEVWQQYVERRPYVAPTPHQEAATIVLQNRDAIAKDAVARNHGSAESVNIALQQLTELLLEPTFVSATSNQSVKQMAVFLDERMCVPRDMGTMPAACIKLVAHPAFTKWSTLTAI